MEKILITGANGFIGSHLIDFIIDRNFEIYGLERKNQIYRNLSHYLDENTADVNIERQIFCGENIKIPTVNNSLALIECDIKNTSLLERIIKNLKPKFIFHFAAQPYIIPSWEDPIDTIKTNVIGTLNIFEPIRKYGLKTRVILACTSAEYGTTAELNRPLNEDDPLLAVHPYGISKVAAELLARQYFINFGIEIINLRFFNQTGIRRTEDAPSDFIRQIVQIELGLKNPIIKVGNLNPYRDFTDIKDSIKAIWLAATEGKPGETYNICSSRKMQIRKILDIALKLSSKKIEVEEKVSQRLRKSDEDVIIGDGSKIRADLGWAPTISIDKTLKEMFKFWLDYYKKNSL
jgi:GDP-4-dehydro-6-deoxy-D-mannose reductase